MNFHQKLQNYAEILVSHGLNVQPGQVVNLAGEYIHADLLNMIAEVAYKKGAKFVGVDLIDARHTRTRILNSTEDGLNYVPSYITLKYDDLMEHVGANLRLIGSEDPDLLADLDTKKLNKMRLASRLALKNFYDEGIGKSKVHWTVAAAATPKWAKKVFPNLTSEEAYSRLWDEIFRICRADKSNCLELWKEHNTRLQNRGKELTELRIKELRFTGPGTDLVVGLSSKAKFIGGGDMSPRGVRFEPNVPTEECFTTPDYRVTRGKVRTTRPFLINGKLVKGLCLEFKDGKIINSTADEGLETFKEYTSSDEGATRLGEVALVGIDSPIFQSGAIFEEILYDENAACHIAIGSAYRFCLEGGTTMNDKDLAEIGCNESSVHTDMMISSEDVDVTAFTYDHKEILLIKSGAWVKN